MNEPFKKKGIQAYLEYVQAMIDGLNNTKLRDDFKIDMSTYGSAGWIKGKHVCFGCAATATVQQVAWIDYKPGDLASRLMGESVRKRASAMGIDTQTLRQFETCIDMFRKGDTWALQDYCEVSVGRRSEGWEMSSTNWRSELPKIQKYVDDLAEKYGYEITPDGE